MKVEAADAKSQPARCGPTNAGMQHFSDPVPVVDKRTHEKRWEFAYKVRTFVRTIDGKEITFDDEPVLPKLNNLATHVNECKKTKGQAPNDDTPPGPKPFNLKRAAEFILRRPSSTRKSLQHIQDFFVCLRHGSWMKAYHAQQERRPLFSSFSSTSRSRSQANPSATNHIDSIPIEILVLILKEYCRACISADSLSLPELHITQVCKYWRSIAVGLPDLWTKLVDMPSHIMATYLQRSQQHPLDLQVDLRHDATDIAECEHALKTWMTIKPSSPRWRRLVMQIGPHYATVIWDDLRELGTPLLEELRISSGSHLSGVTKTFEGRAPLLKSLSLVGLSLERFTLSLHQLTRLHLTSDRPIHFSSFRRLVIKMVKLQDLTLHTRVVEGWPLHPSREDIIILPSLTTLELSDRRWPLFIPLLSLSAPLLHTLSLSDLMPLDLPETFIESEFCKNLPFLRNLVLRGKSLYIKDISFAQLARIFPAIEHFSWLDVEDTLGKHGA
ncbi:hypothetical protein H0H81_011807 [Sphagnurus paluster]|uniref:F-box domain-containing protein n=1 Tax=Sphagnurus paluster TaxID=117069 RepID=A0A9P7KI69_9AGAR|nr:hypothetical protein H0H81_011807 [Sphagnurus paluster]